MVHLGQRLRRVLKIGNWLGILLIPTRNTWAVRQEVGVIDLSHRGRLRLTGNDRTAYLHRIISNDVEGLSIGEGNYATILTNRGKIIADMKVYVFEDSIGIETNAETRSILYQELDKYLIADDVTIEDFTEHTGDVASWAKIY